MEAISKFKILSGLNDEELVTVIWETSKDKVLELTNRKRYVLELDAITLDLALIIYNRIGTEGENSRSEGGISVSYDDLPFSLQRRIETKRIARVGGHAFEKEVVEEVPTSEETTSQE